MTPIIYPDHMRPAQQPPEYRAQDFAMCPVKNKRVFVAKSFNHNAQMYCRECDKVHRVLRSVSGVELV